MVSILGNLVRTPCDHMTSSQRATNLDLTFSLLTYYDHHTFALFLQTK